jgi:hypothetical protein
VTYVDAGRVVATGRQFVAELQGLTLQAREGVTVEKDRYVADLFFMAPLYHRAFTSLDSFMVIDATDLQFHCSVAEVWRQVGISDTSIHPSIHPSIHLLSIGKYPVLEQP